MRTALVLLLALGMARGAPALETARNLVAAGAPHLALARVEQLQPRDSGAARWAEWEALRLSLLVDLGRGEEAMARAARLPNGMPLPQLRQCLMAAARAAVAAEQGALGRAYLARLVWQAEPGADELRAARLLVIESYLAEAQGSLAYRSMLRFEQDYRPLTRDVAERFVAALLDLGMAREAVNWLASLDDAGALKLRLRLDAGLVEPHVAIAAARSALAKGGSAAYWQVLAEAAAKQGNGALRVEALEKLLGGVAVSSRRSRALAATLWRAYADEAQAAANRGHLLAGQDTAWYDLATRWLGSSPFEARALFAHVARSEAAGETRGSAQLQLVFSLQQSGLGGTALSLFHDASERPEGLDPRARFLLGGMADSQQMPALAARFWRGLATPAGNDEAEWQVRRAAVQWRSGQHEAARHALRAVLKRTGPLPREAEARVRALAGEMRDAGAPGAAEEVLAGLLAVAGQAGRRDILLALGELAETTGRYPAAADYYLRAALADESKLTDATALRARLAAATNLTRAGYADDARAQFQWLLKHAKDPAQRDAARRGLARP